MMKVTAGSIAQELRNIGPACAEGLIAVGVESYDDLARMGAKEAFMRLYEAGYLRAGINAAYLYALEGAICDCDWKEIRPERKAEFKELTKEMRSWNR